MSCLHTNLICHVSILTLTCHVSILTLICHVSILTLICQVSILTLVCHVSILTLVYHKISYQVSINWSTLFPTFSKFRRCPGVFQKIPSLSVRNRTKSLHLPVVWCPTARGTVPLKKYSVLVQQESVGAWIAKAARSWALQHPGTWDVPLKVS